MTRNFALVRLSVLTPLLIAASQPVTAPPAPSSNQTQGSASATKATTQTDASCGTTGRAKSSGPKVEHDPSAQVGKDTGWVPPPRKKPVMAQDEPGCAAQPH
jgi:hypothetical protein